MLEAKWESERQAGSTLAAYEVEKSLPYLPIT
jgi:hypothetical protein